MEHSVKVKEEHTSIDEFNANEPFHDEDLDIPEYVNVSEICGSAVKTETFEEPQSLMERICILATSSKKTLYCEYCPKHFSTKKMLMIHTRVHTNERPYKCELCEKSFKQSGNLTSHMVTHSKEKPFPCQLCTGAFTTSSSLKRHVRRIHQTGKVLKCNFCEEGFYNQVSLKDHKVQKHPEIWKRRECPFCKKTLFTAVSYRKHLKAMHSDGNTEGKTNYPVFHKCSLCGNQFSFRDSFIEHINEHLQYSNKEVHLYRKTHCYPCKICHSEFAYKFAAMKHIALMHMEKTRECQVCHFKFSYLGLREHFRNFHKHFECPACQKGLQGRKLFVRHLKNCNLSLQKLATCDICKKIFVNKMQMQIHYMREHNKFSNSAGNYECQICGQVIMTRTYLTRHMRVIHNQSRRIYCNICNKGFKNFSQFDRHNQVTHFLVTNKKLYRCHRCSKKFQKRSLYKAHLSSHWTLDLKRHRCKNCRKCFASRNSFVTHTVRRVCTSRDNQESGDEKDIQQFTCPICNKMYNRDFNLRSHLLLHDISYRRCRFCNVDYQLTSSLKRHMLKKHPGEKVFYCNKCEVAFETYNLLKDHYQAHLRVKEEFDDSPEFPDSGTTYTFPVKQELAKYGQYIKEEKMEDETVT